MAVKDMFQPDSLFNHIMTKVFDLVLLNVLWLICCIPVLTIGASTTALYYMAMKVVRNEEGGICAGFFRAFKENFRQSVPMTLLLLAFGGILAADFHILGGSASGSHAFLYGGCIALFLMGSAVFTYAFPMLARFENTVRATLLNSARIAATHLWQTAAMLAVNGLPAVWFLISPETFSGIFWIWLFAGTGVSAYVNSLLLVRIFDELIP